MLPPLSIQGMLSTADGGEDLSIRVPAAKGDPTTLRFQSNLSDSKLGLCCPSPGHLLGLIVIPLAPPAVWSQQMHSSNEGLP